MNTDTDSRSHFIPSHVLGVLASMALGAIVGLTSWVVILCITGSGVAFSLPDWLLCGAGFGLVVGGIGATISTFSRELLRKSDGKFRCRVEEFSVGVAAVFGSIPGILLGLGFDGGMTEPVIYGTFGAIGAALAAFVDGRRRNERAKQPFMLSGPNDLAESKPFNEP